MITYLVLPGILAAGYVAYQFRNVGSRDEELPPGPPTLTLLGNLHLFPKEFTHLKFTEWAKQYGEIFSLKLSDDTAIILTSIESAKELMDRRSATTVDRPENFMAERITEGKNLMLAGYSEDWRTLRRSAHGVLTPYACARYTQVHHAESSQLLRDILHHPDEWHSHIRRTTSSALMSVLVGRRAPRIETAELEDFVRAQNLWNPAHAPGARLHLDFTPFLNKIPDRWSPWKRLGREVRRLQRRLYLSFLVESEKRVENKSQVGCFMEDFVERQEELGLPRELAGYLGGSLLEGGMDTTAAFLQSLVLAMVTHPEAQYKVQAELDDVVGRERAPTADDLQNLPYMRAVLKEVHRWRPVNPLCLPHATVSDEHYKGHLIPKDATIYVNNWGILHDENTFENAEAFYPERYMKNQFGVRAGTPTRDFRDNLAFGYGRRICPGMHLAKSSININAMRLLWAFNFEPVTNPKTGDPELPDVWHYTKGMVAAPEPFKCKLTPRWPSVTGLIHQDFLASASVFERYEQNLCPEDKAFALKMRASTKRHTI